LLAKNIKEFAHTFPRAMHVVLTSYVVIRIFYILVYYFQFWWRISWLFW